jgi:hypothetical protein
MRKSDLQPLLDYMYWVNHRLLGKAADLTPEQFAESSSVTTRDLRATLVHELDVEWSWRLNLQGRAADADVAAELRPADYPDVQTLREHWDRDEAEMRAWFHSLADDALAQSVSSDFTRDRWPPVAVRGACRYARLAAAGRRGDVADPGRTVARGAGFSGIPAITAPGRGLTGSLGRTVPLTMAKVGTRCGQPSPP